jgi:hypothetical protein
MQSDIDLVLNYEEPAEYQVLRADLIADYRPANARENLLVDQVARAYWRLRRAERTETCALDDRLEALAAETGAANRGDLDTGHGLAAVYMTEPEKRFKQVAQQLRDAQRNWCRAIREIEMVQTRRQRRERNGSGIPSADQTANLTTLAGAPRRHFAADRGPVLVAQDPHRNRGPEPILGSNRSISEPALVQPVRLQPVEHCERRRIRRRPFGREQRNLLVPCVHRTRVAEKPDRLPETVIGSLTDLDRHHTPPSCDR